jgi:hypothetical protein
MVLQFLSAVILCCYTSTANRSMTVVQAATFRLLMFCKNIPQSLHDMVNFCFSDDTGYPLGWIICHPQT